MKSVFSVIAAGVGVFLLVFSTTAQEKSVKPGINKPFENADLKAFLKKFEGESREIAVHAKEIVAACKIQPGMAVADVGAGTGLMTRRFGQAVGAKGTVYAVDISTNFLRHIEESSKEAKLNNVKTIQCDQFSTKLPKNSVDLVFICDTYHHFEFPQRTLKTIHEALRPGGQLIVIDFHRIKGKSSDFVMGHVRAGQEVFVREIKSAGFKVVGEEKFLKENYFVRFEKITEKAQQSFQPMPNFRGETFTVAQDSDKSAREKLAGVWAGFAVEGKGETPDRGAVKLELIISKDLIKAKQFKGKDSFDLGEGTYEILQSKSPNHLDGKKKLDNPNRKDIWLGIYHLDGDTLKWCVGKKARPTEFETKQGSFLLILKRIK